MKYVFLFISLIAAGILFCGCSASQIASTKASGLLSPVLGLTGALAGAEFSKNGSSSVCEKAGIAGTPVQSSQNPA